MTRYLATLILCVSLLNQGCDAATIGGDEGDCPSGDCWNNSNSPGSGQGAGSPSQPATTPNTNPQTGGAALPGCSTDADCKAPNVCNTAAGKCVPPAAKNNGPCDPIEGTACPSGQLCISGVCMPPPGACATNDQCPAGYICASGACVPDTKGQNGCKQSSSCPSGQICINGACKPKGVCNIPHAKDRMKGNWKLDSKLHVRDGLKGFTKGLLSVATTMQSIIDGKFGISGLPSFLTSMIGSLLQGMIAQYVPPWGLQVIKLLATLDDVIDDTRVVSIEHIAPLGNDMYSGWSTWQLVELQYGGVKVSTPPQNIPGLGKVETTKYTAREVCGTFFIDQHKVKNSIGQIYRWAVEALITGISCSMKNTPCYQGINPMFQDLIKCQQLANAMAQQNSYPGLNQLVATACNSQKQTLINLLIKELNDLAVNMTYMSLKAKADIVNNNTMQNGRWYGVLGGTYGKGNFEGNFTAVKMP